MCTICQTVVSFYYVCITHLIIPAIIYRQYYYCHYLTNEKTVSWRRFAQNSQLVRNSAGTEFQTISLQLLTPQVTERGKTRTDNFALRFRALDCFSSLVSLCFLHHSSALNVCVLPHPVHVLKLYPPNLMVLGS